jgi:hypothetical protein
MGLGRVERETDRIMYLICMKEMGEWSAVPLATSALCALNDDADSHFVLWLLHAGT